MNKFEEINKTLEAADISSKGKTEFSKASLEKFDQLMDDKSKKSREMSDASSLSNMIDMIKRRIEGDKYGEMGHKCIAALDEMEDDFEDNNWEQLSSEERAEVLNDLAQKVGFDCGIQIKGVQFFWFPPYANGYENGDGYLHLHEKYLSDPKLKEDALHTLFHEARHTFQNAVVNDPDSFDVDSKIVETWKNNLDNYLTPDKFGYFRYYTQPVEADANAFADYVLKNKG